jgi:hypothetical protein
MMVKNTALIMRIRINSVSDGNRPSRSAPVGW